MFNVLIHCCVTNREEWIVFLHSKMTAFQNNITDRLGSGVRGRGARVRVRPVHHGSQITITTLGLALAVAAQ